MIKEDEIKLINKWNDFINGEISLSEEKLKQIIDDKRKIFINQMRIEEYKIFLIGEYDDLKITLENIAININDRIINKYNSKVRPYTDCKVLLRNILKTMKQHFIEIGQIKINRIIKS